MNMCLSLVNVLYFTAKVAMSHVTNIFHVWLIDKNEYKTKQKEEKPTSAKKMKTWNYELKTNGDTEMIGLELNTES